MKYPILLVLFIILIKVFYYLFFIAVDDSATQKSPDKQYLKIVKKNDTFWYLKIANSGYPVITSKRELGYAKGPDYKQSEWAFFPLYPVLIVFTSKLLNTDFSNSGLVLSILFSIASILGVYWFGLIFFKDKSLAFFSALIMFSFPFSFYFSMLYTEAIYLTLLIFSFISIYYRQYSILFLLLIPLTLVRPNGITMLIPLYLYFLEQNGILKKYSVDRDKFLNKKYLIRSLSFISAPLTFCAYSIYQYKMTGYFFAFSIAQAGWYRELTFPLFSLFNSGDIAIQYNSVFTIIVILYVILIWKKLPFSLNMLIIISLLLPLLSGSVLSMSRFVSVIFPLFLILSSMIFKIKHHYLILALILILHFASFYTWLIGIPLGY